MSRWAVPFSECIDRHSFLLTSAQWEHTAGIIIPIFYLFWHLKLLLTFLLMDSIFHCQQCTVHSCFLTSSLLLSLFLSTVMMAFYSFCFLPLYCLSLKKNVPKPRNLFCLKHWIKLEHPGLFPAPKQIFKTASLFSSAKSPPLMSDFQASLASTTSCFNSYDQIFGIAQGQ